MQKEHSMPLYILILLYTVLPTGLVWKMFIDVVLLTGENLVAFEIIITNLI